MSAIRKSDLQRIIREEYARVLLQRSGHRVTESRVRLIAEKIEDGDLDEGVFGALGGLFGRGAKAAGGAAVSGAKAVGGAVGKAGKAVGGAVGKAGKAVGKAFDEEYVKSELNNAANAIAKIETILNNPKIVNALDAESINAAEEGLAAAQAALRQMTAKAASGGQAASGADEKAAAE